ncbi:hypothetical protein [Caballeronia sordidicola]|uniref:Uncharacterized protein n=1 Tax=Caballeronia sordidicola TaxID=196367 RepID=A0A242N497_CABSO|nr:hypothetical protein [Caballeronia sordidicola]OTP78490.1 hypothetical protein PAMC26577_04825 [Caballeronia sordidicola]
MLTFAKAGDAADVEFRRADLVQHLDDAVAEALQAKISKDCTDHGARALTLALAKLEAAARQCADAQVCLSRPSIQNALISARAKRLRGE